MCQELTCSRHAHIPCNAGSPCALVEVTPPQKGQEVVPASAAASSGQGHKATAPSFLQKMQLPKLGTRKGLWPAPPALGASFSTSCFKPKPSFPCSHPFMPVSLLPCPAPSQHDPCLVPLLAPAPLPLMP